MNLPIKNNNNLQLIISYFGIFPYVYIFFDLSILNLFPKYLLKDFILFYSLIIFTFIGAMRWSFIGSPNKWNVFLGSAPSLISTALIFYTLLVFNKSIIILLIIIFLILQLTVDYFFSRSNRNEEVFFITVRLPITIIICLILFYIIFV